MKQCMRCGQQLNDNEQYCTRCGGTNFRVINNQGQPARPANMQQQRPMQGNNNMSGMQQRQVQNQQQVMQSQQIQQGQQARPQVNRPNQPNRPNQGQQQGQQVQQQNVQNFADTTAQQNNQFTDTPVMKPKKMSKKERQSKELELMYAMKAATERGEYFDEELFKQQHGWYEDGTKASKNTGDMTVVDWIKTLLIMLIPIVNIVVAILGIRNTSNPDYKKNYYKAFIIYYGISLIISILVAFLL